MKYFITNDERQGTCYHEFYPGKVTEATLLWQEDSFYVADEVLMELDGFFQMMKEAIPSYDRYGNTEITPLDWLNIGAFIAEKYPSCQELYDEISPWVNQIFEIEGCFTIIGI